MAPKMLEIHLHYSGTLPCRKNNILFYRVQDSFERNIFRSDKIKNRQYFVCYRDFYKIWAEKIRFKPTYPRLSPPKLPVFVFFRLFT